MCIENHLVETNVAMAMTCIFFPFALPIELFRQTDKDLYCGFLWYSASTCIPMGDSCSDMSIIGEPQRSAFGCLLFSVRIYHTYNVWTFHMQTAIIAVR